VRLGRPAELAGLNASLAGPQLATLSGLAILAARGSNELSTPYARKVLKQGYLGRVGTWLKRAF
jgi:cell division protein FtsA